MVQHERVRSADLVWRDLSGSPHNLSSVTDRDSGFLCLTPRCEMSVRTIGGTLAAFSCKAGDEIEIDMQIHLKELVE